MTSSTSNSEASATLPDRKTQLRGLGKLLQRILLPLAVIGVVTCLGLDWVVKKQIILKTPSHGAAKLLRVREPHPGEIPIIGSSRALCSYIPDSLGTNYYNYGINGIGYAVMDVFLQHELAHRDQTGPIILNFDYGMFYYQIGDLNAYIPNLDIPRLRDLVKRGGRYSGHLEIPGIRYFGCLDAFVRDHLNDRLQLTKAINNGAVLEKATIKSDEFAKLVRQRKDTVEKFEPNMELVDTLIKRITDHPTREFLIVMAPYHSSFYASIAPAGRVRADSIIAALDALPNARFIRFDTRDWPDSLFFNTTHVGLAGARKMSQMLRDSLRPPATSMVAPEEAAASRRRPIDLAASRRRSEEISSTSEPGRLDGNHRVQEASRREANRSISMRQKVRASQRGAISHNSQLITRMLGISQFSILNSQFPIPNPQVAPHS